MMSAVGNSACFQRKDLFFSQDCQYVFDLAQGRSTEMADQFYVNLFSNASSRIFHDNTLSKFKVQLAHPIQLDESYEVALEEISFPFSIKNLTRPSNEFYIVTPSDTGKVEAIKKIRVPAKQDFLPTVKSALKDLYGPKARLDRGENCYYVTLQRNNELRIPGTLARKLGFPEKIFGPGQAIDGYPVDVEQIFDHEVEVELTRVKHAMKQERIEIQEGFYESAEDLIAAINNAYQSHFRLSQSKILLRYNPYIKVVELKMHHNGYMTINPYLSHMLGFGEKTVYTSFSLADRDVLLFPSNYIFAYCDIIEAEHVGDVKAPLLTDSFRGEKKK